MLNLKFVKIDILPSIYLFFSRKRYTCKYIIAHVRKTRECLFITFLMEELHKKMFQNLQIIIITCITIGKISQSSHVLIKYSNEQEEQRAIIIRMKCSNKRKHVRAIILDERLLEIYSNNAQHRRIIICSRAITVKVNVNPLASRLRPRLYWMRICAISSSFVYVQIDLTEMDGYIGYVYWQLDHVSATRVLQDEHGFN